MKPIRGHQRIGNNTKRLCSALEPFEGGRNIIRSPDFRRDDFEAESAGAQSADPLGYNPLYALLHRLGPDYL